REVDHFDDALDLASRCQSKRDGGDEAEQAVAADGQAEELAIFTATAYAHVAVGIDEGERLHVLDDRLEREPASVHVRREGAADAQAVGTRLFLHDRPRARLAGLDPPQVIDQLGPLHAGLDLDEAAVPIE